MIDSEGRITLSRDQRSSIAKRIIAAKRWRIEADRVQGLDAGKFETRAERNLALVNGDYWIKRGMKDVYSIPHLAKGLQVKQAIVCGGDTAWIVDPRNMRFAGIQEVAKPLLNHLWDVLGFDRETDKARWDSGLFPIGGVVEICWRYKDRNIEREGRRPSNFEIADAEMGNEDVDALPMTPEVLAEEPDLGMVPEMAVDGESQYQPANVEPEIDDPFIERFDPRDFFVDPACTTYTLQDAGYIFRRRLPTLSEVKANDRYQGTGKLKGQTYSHFLDQDERPDVETDGVDRVEIWDGYVFLKFPKGSEELYHVVWSPELNRELLCELAPHRFNRCESPFPFEVMPPTVVDNDSLMQVTDAERARDIQVTHDLAFTQLEWSRAHSPNVLKVPIGTFSGEAGLKTKKRIEEGRENAVLELDPAFLQHVTWMDRPPIHTDAYQTLETAPAKILDAIGVSEYQASLVPDKRMTATEANLAGSQGGTRQDAEIEAYFDFLRRCAFKVLILLQQYQDRTREYAFMDSAGQQQWGSVDMAALRGIVPGSETQENPLGDLEDPGIQFTISVDASKKRPKNEQSEQEQAVQLLEIFGQYSQMPDPRLPNRPLVNLPVLLRGLIDKFSIPSADEIIPPPPTEEEIMQFQQEQMMQQQQEAEQMAAEEEARKQQESEAGETQHARDIDKIAANAEAKMMMGGPRQ